MKSEKLKQTMREKKISYTAFAAYLGITRATLYRKIKQISDFSLKDYKKAAELLGEQTAKEIFLTEEER